MTLAEIITTIESNPNYWDTPDCLSKRFRRKSGDNERCVMDRYGDIFWEKCRGFYERYGFNERFTSVRMKSKFITATDWEFIDE